MTKSFITSSLSGFAILAALVVAPACSAQVEGYDEPVQAPVESEADWQEPPVTEGTPDDEMAEPMQETMQEAEPDSIIDPPYETALVPTLEVESLLTFGTLIKDEDGTEIGTIAGLQRSNEGIVTTIMVEDKLTEIPVGTLSADGDALVTSMAADEVK